MCVPEGWEEKAVLNKGQSTSAVLQLNVGQVAAAFITETFLVTPDHCCATSASTYLFHFCVDQFVKAIVNRYKGEL